MRKEMIILDGCESVDIHGLPSCVPSDCSRFHLFVFRHTHEGASFSNLGKPQLLCVTSCSHVQRSTRTVVAQAFSVATTAS